MKSDFVYHSVSSFVGFSIFVLFYYIVYVSAIYYLVFCVPVMSANE